LCPEVRFNVFDGFVKINFRIIRPFQVSQAFGVDEIDVLFTVCKQPQDEVGIEVSGLEKADAAPTGHIAQKIQFLPLKEIFARFTKLLQVEHKIPFPIIQRHRLDFDNIAVDIDQRLVEVTVKHDGLNPLEFHITQFSGLDEVLYFLKLCNDIRPRLLDKEKIILYKIAVFLSNVPVFKMVIFPLGFLELIKPVAILAEQCYGNLLPAAHLGKGPEFHFFTGDIQNIPIGVR